MVKTKARKGYPSEPLDLYRPEIKVLDCTIRDGGLMNDHKFEDEIVKAVYTACVEAGVDYMELGYKASRKGIVVGEHGAWKYCTEEDMRRIVGDNPTSLKLSIMADAERCDYKTDIPPKSESVIDLVRVATYINQIPTALDMVKDAQDKGYETTLNLMAVSTVPERELNEGLELMAQSGTKAIYVVDSFGSLYSEQVHFFVKKYQHACRGAGIEVGCMPTTIFNWASPTPSRRSCWAAISLTPPWRDWAAAPAIARWSCFSVFCTTRNTTSGLCCAACRTDIEPMRKKLNWGFDLSLHDHRTAQPASALRDQIQCHRTEGRYRQVFQYGERLKRWAVEHSDGSWTVAPIIQVRFDGAWKKDGRRSPGPTPVPSQHTICPVT